MAEAVQFQGCRSIFKWQSSVYSIIFLRWDFYFTSEDQVVVENGLIVVKGQFLKFPSLMDFSIQQRHSWTYKDKPLPCSTLWLLGFLGLSGVVCKYSQLKAFLSPQWLFSQKYTNWRAWIKWYKKSTTIDHG